MIKWERAHRLPLGAEIALAFGTGVGTFALAAVVLAGIDTGVVVALLGVVYTLVVVAIARLASVAYAVPVAMAGLLAYDWYYLPPTHPLALPDSGNLVDLIVYLGVAVLLGQLAAHAARRAAAAERARGEIADEQAALRRVATLVAKGVPSSELFGAVAREAGTVLGADFSGLIRYEDDGTVTTLATWAAAGEHPRFADRWRVEPSDPAAMILESGGPVRVDDWSTVPGQTAAFIRDQLGVTSSVGSPIVVEGRLWGALAAHSKLRDPLPPHTEERMSQFAQLLDTAIANAAGRDLLTASRTRLVTAGDEARRRVVRDLHDGAQQRLVHTVMTLKLAQRALRENGGRVEALIGEALEHAQRGQDELRELAHGILPAALISGGLRAGADAVVTRLDVPVRVEVPAERLPAEIEATAYFIVAEALTNVAKHAHAKHAQVNASVDDGTLRIEIRDDGVGGADPDGQGLVGMNDRVTALGGRLQIESPAGGGTRLAATLPVPIRER